MLDCLAELVVVYVCIYGTAAVSSMGGGIQSQGLLPECTCAVVANAEVEEATLLSSAEERTAVREGALVHRSILQWGVTVSKGFTHTQK